MVTIAVMIGLPHGTRLLGASNERDAALRAEEHLLSVAPSQLPVPIWVQSADEGVRARVSAYLAGLQSELAQPRPTRTIG